MAHISVADDVLTAQSGGFSEFPGMFSGWRPVVAFLLTPRGATQLEDLAAAAREAARRFLLISTDGVELPGAWTSLDVRLIDPAIGPLIYANGIVVGGQGEDVVTPPQAATMLRSFSANCRRAAARPMCRVYRVRLMFGICPSRRVLKPLSRLPSGGTEVLPTGDGSCNEQFAP